MKLKETLRRKMQVLVEELREVVGKEVIDIPKARRLLEDIDCLDTMMKLMDSEVAGKRSEEDELIDELRLVVNRSPIDLERVKQIVEELEEISDAKS